MSKESIIVSVFIGLLSFSCDAPRIDHVNTKPIPVVDSEPGVPRFLRRLHEKDVNLGGGDTYMFRADGQYTISMGVYIEEGKWSATGHSLVLQRQICCAFPGYPKKIPRLGADTKTLILSECSPEAVQNCESHLCVRIDDKGQYGVAIFGELCVD